MDFGNVEPAEAYTDLFLFAEHLCERVITTNLMHLG